MDPTSRPSDASSVPPTAGNSSAAAAPAPPPQMWLAWEKDGDDYWLKCILCGKWVTDIKYRNGVLQEEIGSYEGYHGDEGCKNQKDHAKRLRDFKRRGPLVLAKRLECHPGSPGAEPAITATASAPAPSSDAQTTTTRVVETEPERLPQKWLEWAQHNGENDWKSCSKWDDYHGMHGWPGEMNSKEHKKNLQYQQEEEERQQQQQQKQQQQRPPPPTSEALLMSELPRAKKHGEKPERRPHLPRLRTELWKMLQQLWLSPQQEEPQQGAPSSGAARQNPAPTLTTLGQQQQQQQQRPQDLGDERALGLLQTQQTSQCQQSHQHQRAQARDEAASVVHRPKIRVPNC